MFNYPTNTFERLFSVVVSITVWQSGRYKHHVDGKVLDGLVEEVGYDRRPECLLKTLSMCCGVQRKQLGLDGAGLTLGHWKKTVTVVRVTGDGRENNACQGDRQHSDQICTLQPWKRCEYYFMPWGPTEKVSV